MNKVKFLKKVKFTILTILLIGSAVLVSAQSTVTVNTGIRYQTTEGWGTSLCWFGNVIGRWSDRNRNAIADLLFDPVNGLGINLIRYNIGGGDDPGHNHMGYGKEMEGFKSSAGAAYNWGADPGQRWMLQAAKSRIAPGEFITEAFSNSPPYWMTNSGCASGNGGSNNLPSGQYYNFADYLTEVVLHFRDYWGINFRTLEPMNEPSLSWGAFGGQEGCHISREEQDNVIRETYNALARKGLATKIAAMDESSIDDAVASYDYLGPLTRANIYKINTHSYAGSKRQELKAMAKADGKLLWQSECDGSGAPAPFDQFTHNHNDIAPGLDLAMRINRDLREMQPDGWVFWQLVESEQAQINLNKNWGLIHADFENGTETYSLPKKYYTMAQYTKFIRPGDTMVEINNADSVAFINAESNQLVIVRRNTAAGNVDINYNLNSFIPNGPAMVYRTSGSENFQRLSDISLSGNTLTASAGARSITTYIIPGTGTGENPGEITYVNDSVTGSGINQFDYSGSWSSGSQTGAYQSDNHWDSDTGGYFRVRFNGTQIEVYAATAPNHGIAAISIDGGSEIMVDYYSRDRTDQALVYTSPVLPPGNHTLEVRVTGTRNSSSSGAAITADMVRIINSGSAPPPATPPPASPPPTTQPPVGYPGDVNGDGTINIIDALMTAQFGVGLDPRGFLQDNADVNEDGQINIIDALIIARYSVGLIEEF